jgi:2-amino-4-hydroxy-6-hydroxymethyldihydropteridine diphosphokinase
MAVRRAWLCLGGNIGDVRGHLRAAVRLLGERDGIQISAVSSLFSTPPWGKTDQPGFLNACLQVETRLAPLTLLDACLGVERALNRIRGERWGPRTIDIDLLAMESCEFNHPRLTLPHPRIAERAFALVPLGELTPELEIGGVRVRDLILAVDRTGIRKVAEGQSWLLPPE